MTFWTLFRKLIFWLHLTTGAIAGIVVLIMSVTGVLLTYQRQMQYWADTRTYREAPPADATPMPVEQLVAMAEASSAGREPLRVTTVTYRADPSHPVALVAGSRTVFANAFTGRVYGEGKGTRMRAFFSSMVSWHRYIGMSGETRATGRAITGASNLMFLFLVVSGFYLWFPRTWTWPQFRSVLVFRRGLPWKARDFNWHNVIGFWSVVPLAVVVFSGAVISYPWVSNGVYRVMGEAPPVQAPAQPAAGRGQGAGRAAGSAQPAANLTVMFDVARQQHPDWQILGLRLPTGGTPAAMTVDLGDGGQPQSRGTLTLNENGAVVSWAPFSDQTLGRRARSWLRFLHTGEALGLTGQTIAGLVSAGGAVLVYSGFALAFRRFFAWRRRRSLAGSQRAV